MGREIYAVVRQLYDIHRHSNRTIPNMQKFECVLVMDRETGHQRWSNTEEIDTVQRNRLWDTNVAIVDRWINL